MADAVTSQTLVNGGRKLVMKFTNVSDATGETAVTKVDVSALSSIYSEVKIDKIEYATTGMAVRILWDATADVDAWVVPADASGCADFCKAGGLINNAGAGVTGDINFTTVGAGSGDTYSIVLYMTFRESA